MLAWGGQQAAAAPTPTPAASNPSPTPTTVKDAKAQVEEIEDEISAIEEDWEEAKINLEAGQKRVELLQADIEAKRAEVEGLAAQARAIALIRFQGRGVDTTAQIFTSADPGSLIGQLSTASKVDENMNNTLQSHLAEQANLSDMEKLLDAEVASLAAEEERIAKLDAKYKKRLADANALVAKLTAAEQAALAAKNVSFSLAEIPDAPARIKKIIAYAVSHVPGGQYVTGGSGPINFDCSGFTMASYRAAGISLPHSSRAQSTLGTPVAKSDLKPGDLIFWYHPVHHVGLYIGNGKIAHARNPRNDLVIQSLNSYPAPYAGARRIIG
jgi:cell wall-associated NlpC family hydrolase